MFLRWLKRRRRRRILAQPFPADWLDHLHTNVPQYRFLTKVEKTRLQDDLRVFIAEKHWEGCGGLHLTDEIKVTIAALACLLILGLDVDYFARVQSILVYPRGYVGPEVRDPATGLVFDEERLGEAWYRGPVVISWGDVLEAARQPGEHPNVVFHEFAHQLDMLDGALDGTPPLRDAEQARQWRQVMTREFKRLLDASDRGKATLLDDYGAKNEAEFFAVATECFFDQPAAMRRRHPQLYELLKDYYRQDTASRGLG
jgi:Mlc titration factor MtfA (ptsG expression regulator)